MLDLTAAARIWPGSGQDKKNKKNIRRQGQGQGSDPLPWCCPAAVVLLLLHLLASDHLAKRLQAAAPGGLQVPGLTGSGLLLRL